MICAAVALSAIDYTDDTLEDLKLNSYDDDVVNYEAAAAWLTFVAVTGIVFETLLIVIRLLNFSFINTNFLIFAIVVSSYQN